MSIESLNNQPCQIRPMFVEVNSNEPLYYPSVINVNNCSGIKSI